MNIKYFLAQAAVLTSGGVLTILISWYILKEEIGKYFRPAALKESQADEKNQMLPLRLQAHERMIVFIDRLNPSNLFLRLYEQGMSAGELQSRILSEVRSEYQHNVAQQLYINAASWDMLRKLKDDTIAMINNAVGTMPVEASGKDLSRKVLEHVAGMAHNPYDLTIQLIKQDIHQLF